MLSYGACTQKGEFLINESALKNVWSSFFETMLDMFLKYSSREVYILIDPSNLRLD